MKKIPTLFEREFQNHKVVGITDKLTPGLSWEFLASCTPTEKIDGSCCAIIGGELYKRYDAKKGKKPPEGAIPCCDPDPVTGHWPHWVKCDRSNPQDKWFFSALDSTCFGVMGAPDWTYEAIGKHFQGNPYNMAGDMLIDHGHFIIHETLDSFESIRAYLETHNIEGIVWWSNDPDGTVPVCKIKRSDFGLPWPVKEATDGTDKD